MGQGNSTVALARIVQRYLDAIGGSPTAVQRREGSNCRNLLKYLANRGTEELSKEAVEDWLELTSAGRTENRRRRLSTVRRLVALTPGPEAEHIATWIDTNRTRLIRSGVQGKVVAIRPEPGRDVDRGRETFERAEAWYDRDEPQRARALVRRALRLDPYCLKAHALLGVIALEAGRPEAALRQFREALVLSGDPGERDGMEGVPEVLEGLGRTLRSIGCVDEAYEVYTRLRMAGKGWHDHSVPILGAVSLQRGKVSEAAEWFARGAPVQQFNVHLVRLLEDEPLRAMISFCRGVLSNPFVPPTLLGPGDRFAECFSSAQVTQLQGEARRFQTLWGSQWTDYGAQEIMSLVWEHPATRGFLMRSLPLFLRMPTSPKLGAFVHAAAASLVTTYTDWVED